MEEKSAVVKKPRKPRTPKVKIEVPVVPVVVEPAPVQFKIRVTVTPQKPDLLDKIFNPRYWFNKYDPTPEVLWMIAPGVVTADQSKATVYTEISDEMDSYIKYELIANTNVRVDKILVQ